MENEKTEENNPGAKTPKTGWHKFKYVVANFAKLLVIFVFVFLIIYLILNFGSLYAQVTYWFDNDIKDTQYQTPSIIVSQLPSPISSNQLPTDTDSNRVNDNNSNNGGSISAEKQASGEGISISNNQLVVPEIDLRAPILWNIDADKAIDNLRDGLVHINGTALPGQTNGNVFITGHSSYYPWDPGKFKHVFALLPNVAKGDKIYIQFHDTLFKYEVFDTVVVKPNDTWVMQPTNKNIISLMTCVPIGTSLRRLVVRAEQIKPSPTIAVSKKDQKTRLYQAPKNVPDDLMPKIFN